MGAPFLGRQKLWWCEECGVPLVSGTCGCGAVGKKIQLTPPADVRPAFAFDVDRINKLSLAQFGKKLLQGITLVSKLPYEDAAYEIVNDGCVMGRMFYDKFWSLKPTVKGAAYLEGKKTVSVSDDVFGFLKRGDLLGPGVSSCSEDISKGDEVIVCSPKFLGVGTARMCSSEMASREKGIAVKIRETGERTKPKQRDEKSWDYVVEKNRVALDSIESEAKSFIKRTVRKHSLPLTLAFSGGKDSLAVLLLSKEFSPKVVFVDTGLEFPETVNHARKHADIVVKADDFYEHLPGFGPPARDFRWCCKVCKLGPTAKMIQKHFPSGCLTLGGERKYESFSRSKRPRVDQNKWLPKQLSAYPIINWTALEVWLYIFSRKVEYNPLYERGFDRIGCYLCPASDRADLELVRNQTHLLERFDEFLEDYAQKNGLESDFVSGKWRWSKSSKRKGHDFRVVGGLSPCKGDNPRFEGRFNGSVDTERLHNIMGILGETKGSGFVKCREFLVFGDGRFFIQTTDPESALKSARLLRSLVLRANFCTGCGICVSACPNGSIELVNGKMRVKESCRQCLACLEKCPLQMD